MSCSFRIFLPLISLFSLTACPNPSSHPLAIIHYTEVGVCTDVQTQMGARHPAPSNAVYIVFNVSSVDNTQVHATWLLDTSNFRVSPLSSGQLNVVHTGTVTIQANQNVPVNKVVGIQVCDTAPSDALNENINLLYESTPAF